MKINALTNQKVLMVMAHPDDECISGWPILQNPNLKKYLIAVVSDKNNPKMKRYSKRLKPLKEICKLYKIKLMCLNLNSDFYNTLTKCPDFNQNYLHKIQESILKIQREFKPDFVFTHNPHGEYGHPDHKMIFDIIYNLSFIKNLCVTDICEKTKFWPSTQRIPKTEFSLYYKGKPNFSVKLNLNFYIKCKKIYVKYGCWTWRKEVPPKYPLNECKLYFIKTEPNFINKLKTKVLKG